MVFLGMMTLCCCYVYGMIVHRYFVIVVGVFKGGIEGKYYASAEEEKLQLQRYFQVM